MKLPHAIVAKVLVGIEEHLLSLEIPTEMIRRAYEAKIRRLELELESNNIHTRKLCEEINLHIDTIKRWEPK